MTHPIIKTDNYLLVVDESEIKVRDWFYLDDAIIIAQYIADKPVKESKKITFHLPLKNAPTLEGVPLLPPLEDDVEKLEMEYFIELEKRREVAKNFTGQVAGRHPDAFSHSEMIYMNRGYIEGYNKAKEKYNKAKYPVAFHTGHFRNTITNSQGLTQLVGKYIY